MILEARIIEYIETLSKSKLVNFPLSRTSILPRRTMTHQEIEDAQAKHTERDAYVSIIVEKIQHLYTEAAQINSLHFA